MDLKTIRDNETIIKDRNLNTHKYLWTWTNHKTNNTNIYMYKIMYVLILN